MGPRLRRTLEVRRQKSPHAEGHLNVTSVSPKPRALVLEPDPGVRPGEVLDRYCAPDYTHRSGDRTLNRDDFAQIGHRREGPGHRGHGGRARRTGRRHDLRRTAGLPHHAEERSQAPNCCSDGSRPKTLPSVGTHFTTPEILRPLIDVLAPTADLLVTLGLTTTAVDYGDGARWAKDGTFERMLQAAQARTDAAGDLD